MMSSEIRRPRDVREELWPAHELENVPICPVCGATDRDLLYERLFDNVFGCAPGLWSMYRCASCASAYLDPRPTLRAIGKAYEVYHTHRTVPKQATSGRLTLLRLVRRALANGYLNHTYGTRRRPTLTAGRLFARLFPGLREVLDKQFRWLPRAPVKGRLLDAGCGNGDFLAVAQEAGWIAMGFDVDPKSVAIAQERGLNVELGGVENLDQMLPDTFDAVTLSHIVEHVHDPTGLLAAAYRVLKPGGVLYVDTPNIDSRGSRRFGRHWRGLEPPRHMVVFSRQGLSGALAICGFKTLREIRRLRVRRGIYSSSKAIGLREGVLFNERLAHRLDTFAGRIDGGSGDEFLTMLCVK